MGFCNIPDIFQEKIYDLFEVFDTTHVYIDNVLVIKNDFMEHLKYIYKVLQKLAEVGSTVNAEK